MPIGFLAQTQDELQKEQMLRNIYQKLVNKQAIYPNEAAELNKAIDTANKLNKAKTENEVSGDIYSVNAGPGMLGVKSASIKEALFDDEPTVNAVQLHNASSSHAASMPAQPSTEDIFMASLLKDTPHGNYANTIAKTLAETNVTKSHYSKAFKTLQGVASQNFDAVLQDSPELAHPNNVNDAHKYYDLLVHYAPSLAMKPAVASSFIKTTMSYGGIDPKQVGELIKINNDAMKHHSSLEGGV